jgi:hypothetical protein
LHPRVPDLGNTLPTNSPPRGYPSVNTITNSFGGFNSHLVDSREPDASTSTQSSNLDEFIENLDELLLPDLVLQIKKMSFFT